MRIGRKGQTDKDRRKIIRAVLKDMRHNSCRQACLKNNVGIDAFLLWIRKVEPEQGETEYPIQYQSARLSFIENMANEIMEIADMDPRTTDKGNVDGGDVSHRKLRIEARKWLLSKIMPKVYGDRVIVEGDTSPTVNVVNDLRNMKETDLERIRKNIRDSYRY